MTSRCFAASTVVTAQVYSMPRLCLATAEAALNKFRRLTRVRKCTHDELIDPFARTRASRVVPASDHLVSELTCIVAIFWLAQRDVQLCKLAIGRSAEEPAGCTVLQPLRNCDVAVETLMHAIVS